MPPRTPLYWQAVTPSDATVYTAPAVGLYVTGAGAVAFVGNGGAAVTVTVAALSYHWVDVRQVLATGTTATGLFRLVG